MTNNTETKINELNQFIQNRIIDIDNDIENLELKNICLKGNIKTIEEIKGKGRQEPVFRLLVEGKEYAEQVKDNNNELKNLKLKRKKECDKFKKVEEMLKLYKEIEN
ncbi:MAG: hypothetical protein CMJ25_02315 [Phycisphaerae bacterium]|nr:hypothetical protein [Phycisphaerae bacterium]|tara:strand:- start:6486 stop:6806 length:321 start_codon:yes stop_codon:yes gene_type:complete